MRTSRAPIDDTFASSGTPRARRPPFKSCAPGGAKLTEIVVKITGPDGRETEDLLQWWVLAIYNVLTPEQQAEVHRRLREGKLNRRRTSI